MSVHEPVSFGHALRDAGVTFVLSLIVFGPISGLILSGYSFNVDLLPPLIIAAIVAGGRFLIAVAVQTPAGRAFLARFGQRSGGVTVAVRGHKSPLMKVLPLLLVIGVIAPFFMNKYLLTTAILVMIYVLLGLGLNIVVGLAGLLDLGYVAFYAVGAYFLALSSQYLGLGFWTALICAPLLAGLCGMILGFPVLKMHGDYLAIVTLGFGEIIRLVLNNWLDFTGGPNGASAPAPTLFGLEFSLAPKYGGTPFHEFFGLEYDPNLRFEFIFLVLFIVLLLMVRFLTRLRTMPMGRAWEALREDEIACRSLGINHVLVKLSAFMMGAMTGGLAGVFFATYQGFVNPTSFSFIESVLILAIVVLGGMGSTVGVITAAVVLTLMGELLRGVGEYRMLLFGFLMVLMMIWRPRGLIRPKRPAFAPKGV